MALLRDLIRPASLERCGDRSFPVLSMTMHDGIMLQTDRFKKSLASVDQSAYKVVKRDQLVVGFPIDEGVLYIQQVADAGIMSPAYDVWDVDKAKVDLQYFELCLHSPQSMMFYRTNLRGTTARRRSLPKETLLSLPVPVPSMERQREIASTIGRLRKLIELRQRQLRAFDTLIKARFVEMFGTITETVPLSFYIESLTAGKSLAGEEECQNKVLKTGAATYDYFDPSQVKNLPIGYEPLPEHQIHNGDVIISRMNTTELVGAAAYVWQAPERTYLPDRLWKAELTDRADPIFVWQAIVQPKTKEAIRRIAGGTSGSMKNISKPGLLSLHVKKVELEQQKQFAAFVAHVDKSKVVVQRALDKAQLLFEGLMQQYFG